MNRTTLLAIACAVMCLPTAAARAAPPITAVAFAPDGDSLVVGSQAGVAVVNWPALKLLRKMETRVGAVHDLAFSPQGDHLAVAGGRPAQEGMAEILKWPGGVPLALCQGHDDTVQDVEWLGEASIATAGLDHEIILWNTQSAEPASGLRGHSRGVTALCYLADSRVLVSGSLDHNLRVWNVQSGEAERVLNNHTGEVNNLAVHLGAGELPLIASASNDRTVRIWQPTIGRMMRMLRLDSPPLALQWLLDGSLVVAATADGRVVWIDPRTVEIVAEVRALESWAYALAAHPTDGSLVVGGQRGELKRIVRPESH